MPELPAARRRVLFRVPDHELNVCMAAGNERLYAAKDLVVLIQRHVAVVQSGGRRGVQLDQFLTDMLPA